MTKEKNIILVAGALLAVMTACEKTPSIEERYPQMESFYTESCGLQSVSTDSVKTFTVKVDNYTVRNPEAKQHVRYPQIQENIKAASLRLSITINTEWDGETFVDF